MFALIDILPIVLLILVILNAYFIKPAAQIDTNGYLSPDASKNYRGLFALLVVFHHLAQRTSTGVLFPFFSQIGFLTVAVFFFFSGYGLQKSYISKGNEYKKSFLRKRIPRILVPYIFATLVYWLAYFFNGTTYSINDIFAGLANDKPIVANSWYIISILFFYICYWLFMMICKKNFMAIILCGCAWYVAYSAFCIKINFSNHWYNASHLLVIGMIWATYEKSICKFFKRTYPYMLIFVWICFIILFSNNGRLASTNAHSFIVSTSLTIVEAVLFVLGILLLSMKIKMGNPILRFLGNISLEIYLFHGMFILFIQKVIPIQNEFIWSFLVIILTVIFSGIVHTLMAYIFCPKENKQLQK